ncbi:hypothetical protein BV25DRAFT_1936369 [Artomyces pyxidatus]|uniref:Uncharacterized protein n=1 Tax=Artomyces pyxidatus TaxID=48021 RepID=A0ACB8SE60_9AGAM|nr:hypothetical protein BV25DRAFT_1936369 [Artomyces pyxidatus]
MAGQSIPSGTSGISDAEIQETTQAAGVSNSQEAPRTHNARPRGSLDAKEGTGSPKSQSISSKVKLAINMGQGVGFFDDLTYNEHVARDSKEADKFLGNLSWEQTMSEASPSTRTSYSEDNKVHVVQYSEQYPIHKEILLLAEHGVHLPLTVFTNNALHKIMQNPMSFCKKISVETGVPSGHFHLWAGGGSLSGTQSTMNRVQSLPGHNT